MGKTDLKALGASLAEVRAPLNEKAGEFDTRWFHSGQEADLFIWGKGSHIAKIQISWDKHVIEWDETAGLKTGTAETSDEGARIKGSIRIHFSEDIDLTIVNDATVLLAAIPELDPFTKRRLHRLLKP